MNTTGQHSPQEGQAGTVTSSSSKGGGAFQRERLVGGTALVAGVAFYLATRSGWALIAIYVAIAMLMAGLGSRFKGFGFIRYFLAPVVGVSLVFTPLNLWDKYAVQSATVAPKQVAETVLSRKMGEWVRCDTGNQIKFAFQLQPPGASAKWTQNSFGQLSSEGVMQYSVLEMSQCSEKVIGEYGGTTEKKYDCIHAKVTGGPSFLSTTGSNEFRLDEARFGKWDLREWVRERNEYSMRGDTECVF